MKSHTASGIFSFLSILFFCLIPNLTDLWAQTLPPVLSQTHLSPPYAYRISQWKHLPGHRLQVRISLLDHAVDKADLSIGLLLESAHLQIENIHKVPLPFSISGGESILLDLNDISGCFDENNLSVKGQHQQALTLSGGMLPDGLYRLSFQIFETRSQQKVSVEEIPAVFSLVSANPPIWISPADRSTQMYHQGEICFQWTPGHLNANGLFSTEYTLEIAEVPEGANHWREYFHTLPLIFSEKTDQTMMVYKPEEHSLLIPGKQYAFRVHASCINPDGEFLNIKNEGYSEVRLFYYKEECPPVLSVRIGKVTSSQAEISWNLPPQANSFKLQYRKNGKESASWFTHPQNFEEDSDTAILSHLEPSTGYECRLICHCDYSESEENSIYRFTTLSKDNAHLDCGNHPSGTEQNPDQTPLPQLRIFDQVSAANGFSFDITSVNGSNGKFSGTAITRIPLLGNTGVKVKFKNIYVNTQYQLVSGTFQAETDKDKL